MAQLQTIKKEKPLVNTLIVDNHKMLRQGLKKMLSSLKKNLNIQITEADSGAQAILKINQNDFDIVIMDYQMPEISGLETIRRILRFKPRMKIIVLSNYDELAYVESVRDAGAKGYILKDIESEELLKAIIIVLSGNIYYSNEIALKLLESNENHKPSNRFGSAQLTKRELEILKLIAMELSTEEIAEKLFISKKTVDTHRQNLLHKLKVKNTAGLVKAAYKMKLLGD
ncbi:MAG: response regulator transcription factor [Ginsengibacter sp.]